MGIIRAISESKETWRDSPVMIKIMEKDKKRDEQALKKYEQNLKKRK